MAVAAMTMLSDGTVHALDVLELTKQLRQQSFDVAETWAQFADDWHMWAGENAEEWQRLENALSVALKRVALTAANLALRYEAHRHWHGDCDDCTKIYDDITRLGRELNGLGDV